MMQRAALIGGLWLVACGAGSAPPAAAPTETAPSPASQPSVAAPTIEAPPPSDAPGPTASPVPPPEAKPPTPSVREVCLAMCDKVKDKCGKSAFDSCKVNCGKYDPPAAGCEGVVKSALSCARDAADLVCANVAPESCAKQFRQISACASGQKPVEVSEPTPAALPAGFTVYDNAALGIRAPMPEGTAAGSEANVVVQVKHTDGALYTIRKLPRPDGKLNEKVLLKLAMNLFGRCSDKMKMQGMVDKPGRTSINYTMKCPDGAEEAGLFWATDKALFIASIRGNASKQGAEAFLYGFEAK
jgi:hypothetical protein